MNTCFSFLMGLSIIFITCTIPQQLTVDILIQNGIVYDGVTSSPTNKAIGIVKDKIVYFGDEKGVNIVANKIIDATGMIVCPGFIDPHTHADRELREPEKSHNRPFLMQGVTTVVVGNDGAGWLWWWRWVLVVVGAGGVEVCWCWL